MANEVIVVAGATHRAGLLDDYERQLERASVPFHLEMVEPMPAGANSMTMRRKIGFVRAMAEKFIGYRHIYITDAWDVLFFGSLEKLNAYASDLLFSAERNAYPESDVSACGNTLWRYVNAGCMVGAPGALIGWADRIAEIGDLDLLDQQWLNRHLNTNLVPIDIYAQLFYTVAPNEDVLVEWTGRPWNPQYDVYPSFLHFSGGTNADKWRGL